MSVTVDHVYERNILVNTQYESEGEFFSIKTKEREREGADTMDLNGLRRFWILMELEPYPGRDKINVDFYLYPNDEKETEESITRAFTALFKRFGDDVPSGKILTEAQIIWQYPFALPTVDEAKAAVKQAGGVLDNLRRARGAGAAEKPILDLCFQKLTVNGWGDEVVAVFVGAIQDAWPSNRNLVTGGGVHVSIGQEQTRVWSGAVRTGCAIL